MKISGTNTNNGYSHKFADVVFQVSGFQDVIFQVNTLEKQQQNQLRVNLSTLSLIFILFFILLGTMLGQVIC